MKKIVLAIEYLLWSSRLIVFGGSVAGVVAAFALVFLGVYEIGASVISFGGLVSGEVTIYDLQTKVLASVIGAVDYFLIATVLLIFGVGLYELFIGKIEFIEADTRSAKVLEIHSLKELKDKLLQVIHVALVVFFFKYAIKKSYTEVLDLLYLALAIFLIALSIFLGSRK